MHRKRIPLLHSLGVALGNKADQPLVDTTVCHALSHAMRLKGYE